MSEILDDFFYKKTENKLNKGLLYCNEYHNATDSYIRSVLEVSLSEYVDYCINDYQNQVITSKEVIQFSDFGNATLGICQKIYSINNPGLKHYDIGKLLLDDGAERKEGAYVKYGENHAKTATALGLVFEFYNSYYLSCIGEKYIQLTEFERNRLLTRLIIRSALISRVLKATKNGNVNMREFLYMLSDSTYIRRRCNIKKELEVLSQSEEYDFSSFMNYIKL